MSIVFVIVLGLIWAIIVSLAVRDVIGAWVDHHKDNQRFTCRVTGAAWEKARQEWKL